MPTQEMPVKDTLTIQEMARQSGLLTPIPRDQSSGHRRYSADMVGPLYAKRLEVWDEWKETSRAADGE